MKTTHINLKTILTNLFFLFLFVSLLININPDFPFYYSKIHRVIAYVILSAIALFYIHNLVIFPILTVENDKKRYKKFIIRYSLTYLILTLCFWVYHAKISPRSSYIFDINLQKLFAINELSKLFLLSIIPLASTGMLCYTYATITIGKKLIFGYLEFLVNFIIITLLHLISAQHGNGFENLLLTFVLAVFYTNVFYITPILVKKKNKAKHKKELLTLCILYFVVMISSFVTSRSFFINAENFLQLIFNLFAVLCLVLFLSFIYGFYRIKLLSKNQDFTKKIEAKEVELNMLKSQVNPHFLFNTLNTLYSTALEEKASKTSGSIAKLANLLRYMQEDIVKDFIPLENEITYVKDYILIQKLRCAIEPELETTFNNTENYNISPGLLIPFVENAFKYGINPSKKSYLKVAVVCKENTIYFKCLNSYDSSFTTYHKEQGFGIGITNAKQRLRIIYPKNHQLEIKKTDDTFSVNLSITINNND